MKHLLSSRWALPALIILGLVLAIILVKSRKPLEHTNTQLESRPVAVLEIAPIPFRAQVTGYGRVEPAISLQSMAEVSGKISYIHPELKQGASLSAGTLVIKIDPEDYEVSLKQAQAELSASQFTLKQLEEEEKTVVNSLELAQENLSKGEKELQRMQQLLGKQLVSQSAVDQEEQRTLQLRQQVTELQGQLNTFSSRKSSEKARIERYQQQIRSQQTRLNRTEIRLPFDARIGSVNVEKDQFVNVGTTLFEALDIKGVEINTQLPIQHMRMLVSHMDNMPAPETPTPFSENVMENLHLDARVRLVGADDYLSWDARVLRIGESIDPTRNTVSLVVAVDNPYEKMIPGKRPPLLKGMYTAVDITAPAQQAIVIPRPALHENRVYLVNAEQQLEIRPVKVRFKQGDLAVIDSGLNNGDKLIITDLYPVIEQMPVTPQPDSQAEQKLLDQAIGENTGAQP